MTRPRRRWLIVAAAVVTVVGGVAWLRCADSSEVMAAKALTLGMTQADVLSIIGDDPKIMGIEMRYVGPSDSGLMRGYAYSRWFVAKLWLSRKMGWNPTPPAHDDWPVHIRFDVDGRIDRIKRGREIIEVQPSAT